MISDWTIYAVWSPSAGHLVDVACWRCKYAGDDADQAQRLLLEASVDLGRYEDTVDWVSENDLTQVDVMRSVWGNWGLPMWLSEVRDSVEADMYDGFAMPMISVELDYNWEDECPYCEDGISSWLEDEDGLTALESFTPDEVHQLVVVDQTHTLLEDVECEWCDGTGTALRCMECGDGIY